MMSSDKVTYFNQHPWLKRMWVTYRIIIVGIAVLLLPMLLFSPFFLPIGVALIPVFIILYRSVTNVSVFATWLFVLLFLIGTIDAYMKMGKFILGLFESKWDVFFNEMNKMWVVLFLGVSYYVFYRRVKRDFSQDAKSGSPASE